MALEYVECQPAVPDPEENVPTYQYACTACGEQLEAVQSFSDEPLTECPACEGRLRKVFNSVGVVFKGSGFYRTDSRASATDAAKNGAAKPAKSDSSSSGGDSGSSGASTTSSSSSTGSSGSSGGGSTKTPAASTSSAS
ncbi:FmdB family transcriptional regulator [Micromonospora phytophila]|uniref:FmdB family zinc ribbon protein n=1 Tax=Micromonospora phytophila TaxID=709888 RepID=UPI00203080A9|nr:FmdB family zinc ribbon protein [Micromonospora phytophila]MCM0678565.1 FmdB family transcriptional regulator [Micromonospora phytophila]